MELTNDQKATIEYFRKHPGKLVDGRDGSNHGDDLYTIISSVLDYASAESGKEVVMRLEEDTLCFRVYGKGTKSKEELSKSYLDLLFNLGGWMQSHMHRCVGRTIIPIIQYISSIYYQGNLGLYHTLMEDLHLSVVRKECL